MCVQNIANNGAIVSFGWWRDANLSNIEVRRNTVMKGDGSIAQTTAMANWKNVIIEDNTVVGGTGGGVAVMTKDPFPVVGSPLDYFFGFNFKVC